MRSFLIAAVTVAVTTFSALACSSSLDCSLNGECMSGSCVCDSGWTGPACSDLLLAETDPRWGHAWADNSSSWGGLPLRADDGTYHLFYSQFVRGCGLFEWSTNSRIVHAKSPFLNGPFSDVNVVEPAFSHNAQAMRAPDGTWVVFYIGCGQGESIRDCGGSSADSLPLAPRTSPPRPPGWNPSRWCRPIGKEALGEGYVTYTSAPSPDGPWTPLARPAIEGSNDTRRWDTLITNPAPWVLKNGSIVLGLSGDNGSAGKCIGVARADSWNSTFQADTDVAARGGEDPFLWVTPRGDTHVIYHDVSGTSNGGHAFAPAVTPTQWTIGTHTLYTGDVRWANGTNATVFDRERPKLAFDVNGSPAALFNGIAVYRDGRSFTAVTRIN